MLLDVLTTVNEAVKITGLGLTFPPHSQTIKPPLLGHNKLYLFRTACLA